MVFDRWWTQFKAMNAKNFAYRKRHWVQTLFEIIVPLFIILILACIRPAVRKETRAADLHLNDSGLLLDPRVLQAASWLAANLAHPQARRAYSLGFFMDSIEEWNFRIAIVQPKPEVIMPSGKSLYRDFADYIITTFKPISPHIKDHIIEFSSSDAIDDYCDSDDYISDKRRPLLFAVVFDKVSNGDWQYFIRMNVSSTEDKYLQVPDTWVPEPRSAQVTCSDQAWQVCFERGFLGLQSFIDDYFILRTAQCASNGTIDEETVLGHTTKVIPFPTPECHVDPLLDGLPSMISFFFVFAYMWPVAKIINQLVGEKETRTKELFQTMGLYPSVLTAAWLLNYSIIYILSSILMAVATWPVYQYSNKLLIALFFFSFSLAVFAYAYLQQCLFNKSGVATFVGCVGLLILFFPAFTITESTSAGSIGIMSLDFVMAFGLGLFELTKMESGQSGVTWSSWGDGYLHSSLLDATRYLIFDFVWMMLLGLYLERVLPQTYGVREKWYFFCSPAYWQGNSGHTKKPEELAGLKHSEEKKNAVAIEPRDDQQAIQAAEHPDDLAIKTVPPTVFGHIHACLIKRWNNSRRDKGSWAWALLYLLLIVLLVAVSFMGKGAMPAVPTLKMFGPGLYNTPAPTPYNEFAFSDTLFHNSSVYPASELLPVPYAGISAEKDMAKKLLASITNLTKGYDFKESKIGAFFIDPTAANPLSNPTIFFNTTGFHTLPSFFNVLSNYRANQLLKPYNQKIKISTGSKPLPLTAAEMALNNSAIVFAIMAGFAFVPACYAFFIVTHAKAGLVQEEEDNTQLTKLKMAEPSFPIHKMHYQ